MMGNSNSACICYKYTYGCTRAQMKQQVLPVKWKERKTRIVKIKFFVLPIYRVKAECIFVGNRSDLEDGWVDACVGLVAQGHWWWH